MNAPDKVNTDTAVPVTAPADLQLEKPKDRTAAERQRRRRARQRTSEREQLIQDARSDIDWKAVRDDFDKVDRDAKRDTVTADRDTEIGQFDWRDDLVVLHEQPRTAIYFNSDGALVIRQQNWPDEDSWVVITPECIERFIDRLTDVIGVPSFP